MIRFARAICKASKQLNSLSGVLQEIQPITSVQACSYKSHISVDNVYPNSNPDFLRKRDQETPQSPDKFSGYIPIDEVKITTSRSSGPGGQNVNTVNSKVEIRFHLDSATWIPEAVKTRLAENESGRITKDGYFVMRSDSTRKQLLNQADCLEKIRYLIYKAAAMIKVPTDEQLKVKEERLAKAKASVLREKRNNSNTRQYKKELLSS